MSCPKTPEEFYALFGRFKYTSLPDGAILITDRPWQKSIVRSKFGPRGLWIHRAVAQSVDDVWDRWVALKHQYNVYRAEAFCPRHQMWSAKKPLSIHSWGAAIDINPAQNMPGVAGNLPSELVRLFESAGWQWGGRWKSKDPMHFQYYTGKSF